MGYGPHSPPRPAKVGTEVFILGSLTYLGSGYRLLFSNIEAPFDSSNNIGDRFWVDVSR